MSSSIFKISSAASTNLNQIGQNQNTKCHGWNICNTVASNRYVKLYWGVPGTFSSNNDVPTVGTDVPLITIEVPASGNQIQSFPYGIGNQGSMFLATTTGAADNNSTAVGAGDLLISIMYG